MDAWPIPEFQPISEEKKQEILESAERRRTRRREYRYLRRLFQKCVENQTPLPLELHLSNGWSCSQKLTIKIKKISNKHKPFSLRVKVQEDNAIACGNCCPRASYLPVWSNISFLLRDQVRFGTSPRFIKTPDVLLMDQVRTSATGIRPFANLAQYECPLNTHSFMALFILNVPRIALAPILSTILHPLLDIKDLITIIVEYLSFIAFNPN